MEGLFRHSQQTSTTNNYNSEIGANVLAKAELPKLIKDLHRGFDLDEALVTLTDGSVLRVTYFGELSIGDVCVLVELAEGKETTINLNEIQEMLITRSAGGCSIRGETTDTKVIVQQ